LTKAARASRGAKASAEKDRGRRLRVLLINETCNSGVGRHVADVSDWLRRQGHVVHLLYSPGRVDAMFQRFLDGAEAAGITTTAMAMSRAPRAADLALMLSARRWIRDNGPFDIIHGHSSKGGAVARMAGSGQGVVVYTPHALVTMNPTLGPMARRVYTGIERFLARLTDGIIAVSEDEREHAVSIGLPADRIHVIPNGIPTPMNAPRAAARKALGLKEVDFCVGFIGRMSAQKAPDELMRAFARAFGSETSAHLALVGYGDLEEPCRTLAASLGLGDRAHVTGEMDGKAVIAGFDAMGLASRYEAHAYVIVEALFAGLPIVATRVGGVCGPVTDGENGLIVAPGDTEAMAAALRRAFEDKAWRERAGKESLRRATDYTVESMGKKLIDLYRSLASARAGV